MIILKYERILVSFSKIRGERKQKELMHFDECVKSTFPLLKKFVICYDRVKARPDKNFMAKKFVGISPEQITKLVTR